MVASPPFSTGYALWACFRAKAKVPARIGLALAAAELLLIVALTLNDLLPGDGG